MSSTQYESTPYPSETPAEGRMRPPGPPAPQVVEAAVTSLPSLASGVPTSVFGFAIVITMLSLNTSSILDSGALFIPAATVVGFFVIGIGGLYELRNGDIFGGTFGVAYAGFLLATGVTLRFFLPVAIATPKTVDDFNNALGTWFLLWAVITAFFTIAARLVNVTAFIAFALLTVTLALIGLAFILVDGAVLTESSLYKASGWFGIADGISAFWLAGGLMVNSMYAKSMLPLGAPK